MWTWVNIDWTKTLAAGVALATIVQALVAVLMMRSLHYSAQTVRAASETLMHMRETTRLQLRAYVGTTFVKFSGFRPGEKIRASVQFKNSGLTPAFNFRARAVILITTKEHAMELPAPSLDDEGIMLGVERIVVAHTARPAEYWEGAFDRLLAGELVLVLRSAYSYQDAFGEQHSGELLNWCNDPKAHQLDEGLAVLV